MKICGLQKLTLLDYPSKVACTVFTYGCNFRCPFCHNASLVTGKINGEISESELFSFLNKRKGVLDGVCITGGEPLLHNDIGIMAEKIKSLGYSVKLDTNGSFPDVLKSLVNNKLIDYVAMDIKNGFDKYSISAGTNVDTKKISESIDFLKTDVVDYEFRTTVYKGAFDKETMIDIGKKIEGAKRYFLQNFVNSGNLIGKAEGVDETYMTELLETVKTYVPNAELRGI